MQIKKGRIFSLILPLPLSRDAGKAGGKVIQIGWSICNPDLNTNMVKLPSPPPPPPPPLKKKNI